MPRIAPKESATDSVNSPTVRHRWLSLTLRELRQAAGLSQKEAATAVGWSHGTVGHLETRTVPVQRKHLLALLPLYGVQADRIDWYLVQSDRAREKGWWDDDPGVPDWFSLYIGLEWGASDINSYHLGYVPGLLQTRGYAEAILRDGASNDAEVAHQLTQRLRRQDALTRTKHPLRLHAILDEAVLHRAVGGPAVMRDQLAHLTGLIRGSNLHIQVLPFRSGVHRGQLGSFSWLGFPHDEDDADQATVELRERLDPGVVYLENQLGGVCLDDKPKIDHFRPIFADLAQRALPTEQSAAMIDTLARGFAE